MLKVDRNTTLKDFSPFTRIISGDDWQRIRNAAVRDLFGEAGFYALTIGQLTTVIAGDARPLLQSGGRTVYDYARVEAFSDFVDDFTATLQRLTPPPTAEGLRLSSGTLPNDFTESVYLFCRSYFGLASFKDADRLLVSEYVQAKKDDYNRQIVDRNVAASMRKGGKQ